MQPILATSYYTAPISWWDRRFRLSPPARAGALVAARYYTPHNSSQLAKNGQELSWRTHSCVQRRHSCRRCTSGIPACVLLAPCFLVDRDDLGVQHSNRAARVSERCSTGILACVPGQSCHRVSPQGRKTQARMPVLQRQGLRPRFGCGSAASWGRLIACPRSHSAQAECGELWLAASGQAACTELRRWCTKQ
jgi:hypothetical protein